MKLKPFIEAKGDTAVFTFGRFNPPTTGHEKLIDALAKQQKRNTGSLMYVFPSHSQDPKKNPLPHAKKVAYMKKMFRKYAKNITVHKSRNVFEVAVYLHDKGHRAVVMVVGSDRVAEFDRLLNEYNGVKGRHGYYGFDNIEVISAGARDPDAEGVEGMSASKMRAAAADGDYDSFVQGVPKSFKDGKQLFRDVRANMGIREEKDMGDMDEYEEMRDAYLTGKLWNIGENVIVNGVEGEVVRKGTNYLSYMTEDGKVHKAWLHQIDERDYKKEYANYQGKPEQIARRSSRNKARRIMGDKTKIGMDVGHKDNNPMNNDPNNLRNEVPSDNRREPRLREIAGRKLTATDQSELYRLTALAMRKPGGSPAQKAIIKKLNVLRKKQGLKPIGEAVELDELSSMLPWLDRAAAKVSQITHPKGWDSLVKRYVDGMKDKEHQAHPGAWAGELARQYRGVNSRDLVKYINKLVDKGKLPKELKAELEPQKEQWNFKDFVEKINRNAKNHKRN